MTLEGWTKKHTLEHSSNNWLCCKPGLEVGCHGPLWHTGTFL